ncbi:barstar family protein [Tatumella sp. JGM118]|uniref:barstar family protein n=1 Tax=Tatumella sp. JGM118 TaxID=2799796 RepID=UPI001BAF2A64|nr:barstar family protein [Tatumella sp. JGM118]MBS0908245.1 barstar family protein [Tatumella sp. JGM118]
MLTIVFDFRELTSRTAFYHHLVQHSHCPPAFGNNLDALWDWLTGGMTLPAVFRLENLSCVTDELTPVLAVLHEASAALDGRLSLVSGAPAGEVSLRDRPAPSD